MKREGLFRELPWYLFLPVTFVLEEAEEVEKAPCGCIYNQNTSEISPCKSDSWMFTAKGKFLLGICYFPSSFRSGVSNREEKGLRGSINHESPSEISLRKSHSRNFTAKEISYSVIRTS